MKRIVFQIVALITSLVLHGQQTANYLYYHDEMIRIEDSNSREYFDSSITMYLDLFKKYDRVFSKDAYNACQIAALVKHNSFSYFVCKLPQN